MERAARPVRQCPPTGASLRPLGFPPEHRLRKRQDYLRVQDAGLRVSTPEFILLVQARDDGLPARLGVTVTKKFGSAPRRNRIRRLLREAFRQNRGLVPEGVDVVIIPRGERAPMDFPSVVAALGRARARVHEKAARSRSELAKSSGRPHTGVSAPEIDP